MLIYPVVAILLKLPGNKDPVGIDFIAGIVFYSSAVESLDDKVLFCYSTIYFLIESTVVSIKTSLKSL